MSHATGQSSYRTPSRLMSSQTKPSPGRHPAFHWTPSLPSEMPRTPRDGLPKSLPRHPKMSLTRLFRAFAGASRFPRWKLSRRRAPRLLRVSTGLRSRSLSGWRHPPPGTEPHPRSRRAPLSRLAVSSSCAYATRLSTFRRKSSCDASDDTMSPPISDDLARSIRGMSAGRT